MPDGQRSLVVVGASAGGVEALQRFVRALPADFPAPVLVVLHASPTGRSYLPEILSRAGILPAAVAHDGEAPLPGHVYTPAADAHLELEDSVMRLVRGPHENGHRPAIDPLFRTAAEAYGARVAGVVLSGTLDDGTVGLYSIKQAGGKTLVQDPDDALYADMPLNAIAYAQPDVIGTVEELVDALVGLTRVSPAVVPGRNGSLDGDDPDDPAPAPGAEDAQPGVIVPFSCPDCGGTLWETEAGGTTSYRCRIGHAYTMNTLLARHAATVERTLWIAFRALEERAAMSRRVARRLSSRGHHAPAARFERQAEVAERNAADLKLVLDELETTSAETTQEATG